METITLNDGTTLDGVCTEDDRYLYVYLDGLSLSEGFGYFSNPNNTIRIVAMNHGNEHIYEGYTVIKAINTEFGNCNLTMQRG